MKFVKFVIRQVKFVFLALKFLNKFLKKCLRLIYDLINNKCNVILQTNQFELIGLVSFGLGHQCGNPEVVYTRVTADLVKWINMAAFS